ncbi:MAG: OmpA family protein [Patescibacteria group bacterium]|nr:OmpA family protein [Patescibacteria group bacterium]
MKRILFVLLALLAACPGASAKGFVIGEKEGQIWVQGKIYFELDSSALNPKSSGPLGELASYLRHHPELKRVEIAVHADERGDPSHYLALTEQRAETLKEFLELCGVAPERLIAKGYGATEPLDPRHNEEARAHNRRVDFRILEKEAALPQKEDKEGRPGHKAKRRQTKRRQDRR